MESSTNLQARQPQWQVLAGSDVGSGAVHEHAAAALRWGQRLDA
jgi:hypothetical protein